MTSDMPSRPRFHLWPLAAFLTLTATLALLVTSIKQRQNTTSKAAVLSETAVRNIAGDFWADVVIGKRDFTEIAAREIVPYKVNEAGGVVVDRSVSPGRAYVWDSGNNRILGLDLAKCYDGSSPCTADIIIGQPSGSD